MTSQQALDLDEIETRASALYEYAVLTKSSGADSQAEADQLTGTDVPALAAEIRHLRAQRKHLLGQLAKRDAASGEADRKVREFLTAEEPFAAEELAAAQADVDALDAEFPDDERSA